MPARFHPAVWFCAWGTFVLLLQRLDPVWLLRLSLPVALLAGCLAARETYRMLKRARWLLLSIAVLFLVATPGVRMPGIPGAAGLSFEGLSLAAEHLLRLILLLATLATLLRILGRAGVLSGLHDILAPIGRHRERLVARLMLTLEFADRDQSPTPWQDWLLVDTDDRVETISLAASTLQGHDRVLLFLFAVVAIVSVLP